MSSRVVAKNKVCTWPLFEVTPLSGFYSKIANLAKNKLFRAEIFGAPSP
jgi:hypothetical protein